MQSNIHSAADAIGVVASELCCSRTFDFYSPAIKTRAYKIKQQRIPTTADKNATFFYQIRFNLASISGTIEWVENCNRILLASSNVSSIQGRRLWKETAKVGDVYARKTGFIPAHGRHSAVVGRLGALVLNCKASQFRLNESVEGVKGETWRHSEANGGGCKKWWSLTAVDKEIEQKLLWGKHHMGADIICVGAHYMLMCE